MGNTSTIMRRLGTLEAPFVMNTDSDFPVVIKRASGFEVWSEEGRKYVDLTAFFGAMAVGHSNPAVVQAVQKQAAMLIHGMGDVHPPEVKVRFMEALQRAMSGADYRFYMGLNGADAVDTALKIAFAATGRPGVIAFERGYHGLYSGALRCTHRQAFREPFSRIIGPMASFLPFPEQGSGVGLELLEKALSSGDFGAVIVEPIQGRGGIRVMEQGMLAQIQALARRYDAVLIVDEIFTGMHRTGPFLASLSQGVTPDILCLGKALGGGLPLSVTAARPWVLEGMGRADAEAIHTATFISHPLSAAAGLAVLEQADILDLETRAKAIEKVFFQYFSEMPPGVVQVRGRGGMLGIQLDDTIDLAGLHRCIKEQGILVLPAGPKGRVIEFTPPLIIDLAVFENALDGVVQCLKNSRK